MRRPAFDSLVFPQSDPWACILRRRQEFDTCPFKNAVDLFDYADAHCLIAVFKPHESMTANACPLSHFLLTQIGKDSRRTQHLDRRDSHHRSKSAAKHDRCQQYNLRRYNGDLLDFIYDLMSLKDSKRR